MTPMMHTAPAKYYQPAPGFLRLSLSQITELRRLHGLMAAFLAEHAGAEARLVLIVKRGKLRFAEIELPAQGDFPTRGHGRLPDATLQQVDAKLSSLCAFTADGGEARLILEINSRGETGMRMVLSQELGPARL